MVAWSGELGFGVRPPELAQTQPTGRTTEADEDADDDGARCATAGGTTDGRSSSSSSPAPIVLVGALGVVLRQQPGALRAQLVMTLFGIAVLFVAQEADFLAAVQVIVYAGAIVVLFLFVIMLLGRRPRRGPRLEPLGGAAARRRSSPASPSGAAVARGHLRRAPARSRASALRQRRAE